MESGVEFIAVDNPHANKLTVHILAAVAQREREMISERTNTQSLKARLSLFPAPDESDSCRTMEVRHVSTATVAPGF
jgi:hypothetical protein